MKKSIVAVVILVILTSSMAFGVEGGFEDRSRIERIEWKIQEIRLQKEGITLLELAEIINKEKEITYGNYEYYRSHIKDTANRDMIKLYSEGIIQGDGKGYLRADRILTDVEIQAILSRLENPLKVARPTYTRRKRIPILAYHVIKPLPEGGSAGIYVHPERFIEQLEALKNNGYNAVTMEQVYDHWKNKQPLPEKPIVLSFDDGYDSHFNIAAKELNKRGMVGSFYIITSHVGDDLRVKPHQVREMYRDGMEIGSHTANHINAKTSSNELITEEYRKSKEELENILGIKIEHFCYPFGNPTNHAVSTLKRLGYKTSVMTRNRQATDMQSIHKLERINVDYYHSTSQILNKLK